MAKKHGRGGVVKMGVNDVGEIQNWEFTHSVGVDEATSMGDTSVYRQSNGFKDAQGSIVFMYDGTDTGQTSITVGAELTLQLYSDGDASGAEYWQVDVLINEISRPQSKDGFIIHTASWLGMGDVTEGTVV